MDNKIAVGIVLYNPNCNRLKQNIEAIIQQTDRMVIVDNGSSVNRHSSHELIGSYCNIHIVDNDKNMGIAYALNQIMEWGKINGYEWIVLLDQDTICPPNIIEEYSKLICSKQGNQNYGIICPVIYDINEKTYHGDKNINVTRSDEVITSGSCINIEVWYKLQGFDDRLFIDYVDTEFNERCLRAGYKIVRNTEVCIQHEVGKAKIINIGKWKIQCSNHNAFRRYYMVRNRLYFQRKYFGRMAFLKEAMRLLLGTFKIVLFEKEKWKKVVAYYKGFIDCFKLKENKENSYEYK